MAKELIFDSERLERKQRRRRILIPAACAAGLLLLIVLISAIFFRGSSEETVKGGEDTPYPFEWTMKSDGSCLVTVSRPKDGGASWELSLENEQNRFVRAEKKSGGKKEDSFLMTPLEEGSALICLVLTGDEAQTDVRYTTALRVDVAKDGETLRSSIGASVGKPGITRVEGGQDSENPYRISTERSGQLSIDVAGPAQEYDWDGESSDENVAVFLGVTRSGSEWHAVFGPGETPGECRIALFSDIANATIRATVVLDEDGRLSVTEHSAEYGEKDASYFPPQTEPDETGEADTTPAETDEPGKELSDREPGSHDVGKSRQDDPNNPDEEPETIVESEWTGN